MKPRIWTRMKPTGREVSYLAWIRSLPCAVCGRYGSEAAHTRALGAKGMAQRSPDRSAIPLCRNCHRMSDTSYHVITPEYRWAELHALDLHELVKSLNHGFELLQSLKVKRQE